ncbi:MAG: response regulator transcription factor [Defluviitaleaceae bacterium]|nr:response regulator transcription factor [Defluviitaleaceae bacterium]
MDSIFILEDDDNIRELVSYALESAGFSTTGFANGEGFWREIRGGAKPSLLLLDLMLPEPGGDGLAILRKLKDSDLSLIPVIIMTAKGGEHERIRGLDLGADDYVTKPFSVLELTSRVKAVLRRCGKTASDAAVSAPLAVGGIEIFPDQRRVVVDDVPLQLTYKEFELLLYLMLHRGTVLTRNQIIESVWGFEFEGESRTVDMHIKTLRQKLGDKAERIETVRNVGYRIS